MGLLKVPSNGRIAVIGSGISGLTFSYFLTKLRPDIHIDLYEKQHNTGGWIKSLNLKDKESKEEICIEKGPRTLRGVSEGTLLIVDILKNLNCKNQIETIARDSISNKKYLLNNEDQLIEVPNSLKSFSSFLFGGMLSGVFQGVLGEPFRKSKLQDGEDESIESFIKRRFGSTIISDRILSAVMHGIYAGDISKLSIRSTLPRLLELEKEHGSVIKAAIMGIFNYKKADKEKEFSSVAIKKYEDLISPEADMKALSKNLKQYPMIKLRNGLQSLPNAITRYLEQQSNVNIIYDSKISEINPTKSTITTNGNQSIQYDHIRSTINSNELSKMLVNVPSEFSKSLKIPFVSVFLCNVYSKNRNLIPKGKHGFGFLVPKYNKNPENLLGVIYDSDIEQHSEGLYAIKEEKIDQNYNKITLMIGGHHFDSSNIPSDSINVKIVKNILSNTLGVDLKKLNIIVRDEASEKDKSLTLRSNDLLISYNLVEDCIPQYHVGYNEQKNKVGNFLSNQLGGKFSVGGMCFGNGIGVPDCVLNSLEDALRVH